MSAKWAGSDLSDTSAAGLGRLDFSADGDRGFGDYHDLYDSGTSVSRIEGSFRASVEAYRFPRMLLFNRKVAGVAHHRTACRVRRDGFDHVNLQVLRSGRMAAGAPGHERAMSPGDIVVFDTTRPQRTFVAEADYLSVAITRDAITTALPNVGGLHGEILSRGASGPLVDLLLALGHHVASLSPEAAGESAGLAGLLLGGVADRGLASARRNTDTAAALEMHRWRAEAYIEAHLHRRDLDADAVAAKLGVTRTTLYQAFAPVNGVAREILRRRVKRMADALARPDDTRSIVALAFDLGFADQSHCSRAFKTAFGRSPREFRAENRQSGAWPSPALEAGGWAAWWGDIS